MNWIFDHLQLVIVAAAAIAYWLNQAKDKGRDAANGTSRETADRPAQAAAEDFERTRRIQEEIRRKIAGRQATGVPTPPPLTEPSDRPLAPPLVAPRPVAEGYARGLRERLEARLAQMQAREEAGAAAREKQRQQEGQRRLIEEQKLAVQRLAALEPAAARPTATEANAQTSRGWRDELRDHRSARRAMVLREVLGAPVGLRPDVPSPFNL